MRGRTLRESAKSPSGDWPATPLPSAVSGESATTDPSSHACLPGPAEDEDDAQKNARYVLIQSDPLGRRMSRLSFLYTPWAGEPGATPKTKTMRKRTPERHLRAEPHRLLGSALKSTVQLLSGYELRTVEELRAHKPQPEDECEQIQQLASYSGSRCLEPGCDYAMRHRRKRREHCASAHIRKAAGHSEGNPLWEECMLQTVGGVHTTDEGEESNRIGIITTAIERRGGEAVHEARGGLLRHQGGYRGVGQHRLWLCGLQIWSSYRLPPKKEVDGAGAEGAADPDLVCILAAAEAILRDAYKLCSDTSPDRKMTQQRANILSDFYTGASGKADGFRHFKNPSTLVTYFTTMKQLLVYYYRIVHCEGGHFARAKPDQVLPRDIIRPTKAQAQAIDEIMEALAVEDEAEAEPALKHAIRRLYLALICHTVGSVPFKSPILSFCAILSRRVRRKGRGL
ncbi:hypothetical protein V491_00528 [Pseudogymnoascus sp. VKM F-3775]|nr:hypothetical protein V491_00528 [Pseudogymnoascus sp. VKM F-3775]